MRYEVVVIGDGDELLLFDCDTLEEAESMKDGLSIVIREVEDEEV